jgi:hypothetical protein
VHTMPTIGFNVEKMQYKNIEFAAWDIGTELMIPCKPISILPSPLLEGLDTALTPASLTHHRRGTEEDSCPVASLLRWHRRACVRH